jgi:SAM-dependent methyltransferase
MGVWRERILPRMVAWGMKGEVFAKERAQLVPRARGRVLELGFGAGLNLPFYGDEVEELVALEPARVNERLAAERVAEARFPVRFVAGSAGKGARLPLEGASFDTVLSTWTMCSIEDLGAALAEARRALRPGGRLLFVEHGLAPSPRVARWQRRLTPFQRRWAGGCRLDRRIDRAVLEAGFALEELEQHALEGPRILTWTYRGVARPG